jgi:hypothetical protein
MRKEYCNCNSKWLHPKSRMVFFKKFGISDSEIETMEYKKCPVCKYYYWYLTDEEEIYWGKLARKE